MNQTQVNNFLKCLLQIDDLNYLALHENAAQINGNSSTKSFHTAKLVTSDSDHDGDDHDHDGDDHDHDHDHDHDYVSADDYNLIVAKVTAMIVLCCASAICGSVPFLLNRYFKWTENNTNARSATIVKCLLYFGGGVLLCTTFQHLLPEVQELVEQLQKCNRLPELPFAMAQLLMCGGFFLMYFIEEVIHAYIHRNRRLLQQDDGAGAAFERGHSVRRSYLIRGTHKEKSEDHDHSSSSLDEYTSSSSSTGSEVASAAVSAAKISKVCVDGKSVGSGANVTLSIQDLITHDDDDVRRQKYQQHNVHQLVDKYEKQPPSHYDDHNHIQHAHHAHHHHEDYQHDHGHSHLPIGCADESDDIFTSSIRGLFIVLALSLHELFEGMAIGLEGSASSVWFMFGAVSAHKLVLAFCVGVELIVARTRILLAVIYVLTFAVVSPLGIGIGILISHNDQASGPTLPSAILQGLACGTLLYVVFFEILSKNNSGLLAYFALFAGFVIMFGLQQLGTDEHGHTHGSCNGNSDSDPGHAHDAHSLNHHHDDHHHHHHHHDELAGSSAQHSPFEEQLKILRQASQHLLQKQQQQ